MTCQIKGLAPGFLSVPLLRQEAPLAPKTTQAAQTCPMFHPAAAPQRACAHNLDQRVSVIPTAPKEPQFPKEFFQAARSCVYTMKGKTMTRHAAFTAAVDSLKRVKSRGGTVYVVGTGKDQIASHFTTDLMKGLGIASQTLRPDSPELEFLKPEDLVVMIDGSADSLRAGSKTPLPEIITVGEGLGSGDLNFLIGKVKDPAVGQMVRLYILHTMVDLYLNPKADVKVRTSELNASVSTCVHTNEKGVLISPAESAKRALVMMEAVKAKKGTIYVIGNGGSNQIASDIKDLLLKKGILSKTLTANACLTTCLSNDLGYDKVFSDQLQKLLKPEDLVISISSSGKSPNILNAAQVAKTKKVAAITLSGFGADNPLRTLGDLNMFIGRNDYGLVEMGHFFLLLDLVNSLPTPLRSKL